MVKVFLSYKHGATDAALVDRLAGELSQGGHHVFFDRAIPLGVRFAAYIEKQLRSCDFFVVLVTQAAHDSEWNRTELSVANELAREKDGGPRVIGLILEEFTWDIEWRVYLDKWQHLYCLDQRKEWDNAVAAIRKELASLDAGGRIAHAPSF